MAVQQVLVLEEEQVLVLEEQVAALSLKAVMTREQVLQVKGETEVMSPAGVVTTRRLEALVVVIKSLASVTTGFSTQERNVMVPTSEARHAAVWGWVKES